MSAIEPGLGDRVTERYTGIEGTVVAITNWLHRSTECALVRDGVDHNGQPWELRWIAVGQITACESAS